MLQLARRQTVITGRYNFLTGRFLHPPPIQTCDVTVPHTTATTAPTFLPDDRLHTFKFKSKTPACEAQTYSINVFPVGEKNKCAHNIGVYREYVAESRPETTHAVV